jgi:hypothetical protein
MGFLFDVAIGPMISHVIPGVLSPVRATAD